MPRPNTTYKILNSSNNVLYSGLGFYEAFEKARTEGKAAKITDASGKVIFVKEAQQLHIKYINSMIIMANSILKAQPIMEQVC